MSKNQWSDLTKSLLALLSIILLIIGCTPTAGQVRDTVEPSTTTLVELEKPFRATAVPSPTTLPEPIILTPAAEAEPTVTIDPFSNSYSIVATLNEFAAIQEAALLGQSCWILIQRTELFSAHPREGIYRGPNGAAMPMEELTPNNSPIFETWYHIDETGEYHEGLGIGLSADGAVYQKTLLMDGQWINLTLRENGFSNAQSRQHTNKIELPTSHIAQWLEEIHTSPRVTLTAHQAGEEYIVIRETRYDEPFHVETTVPQLPAPAIGERSVYTFNLQTGQLLTEAGYSILEDGSLFLIEETAVHVEFITELRPKKAQLYYDAVNELKNE